LAGTYSPAFFLAGFYAIATHQDGTLVAPVGVFPGSSPAARGETITLWGTGFGPVSPSVPVGVTPSQAIGGEIAFVSAKTTVTIGGVPAEVAAAALNSSALGLYQLAVTIPQAAASGDQPVVASAGGISSPSSGALTSVE
jgi:uncharacterized protein (TIGR03437 family)